MHSLELFCLPSVKLGNTDHRGSGTFWKVVQLHSVSRKLVPFCALPFHAMWRKLSGAKSNEGELYAVYNFHFHVLGLFNVNVRLRMTRSRSVFFVRLGFWQISADNVFPNVLVVRFDVLLWRNSGNVSFRLAYLLEWVSELFLNGTAAQLDCPLQCHCHSRWLLWRKYITIT